MTFTICQYLFVFLLSQQMSTEDFHVTEKSENGENFVYKSDIDHLKEVKGVRWSVGDNPVSPSNHVGNHGNEVIARKSKTLVWDLDEYYWKGEDENKFMDKSMYHKNISVWRDTNECQHALDMVRKHIRKNMIVHKIDISMKAERWAIALASYLDENDPEKIYMSKAEGYGGTYGQLIYYADGLNQAPGCSMALTAWLSMAYLKLELVNQTVIKNTKAIAGDYEQLVWEHSHYFGVGLSYNEKKKAGYVVMFFNTKFIEGESVLNFKMPEGRIVRLDVAFWEFLLPGFRNPLTDVINYETNLGYIPCISRRYHCDRWAAEGQCDVPALKSYMRHYCYRSCKGCVRTEDVPIDGGWSAWTQVSECSATDCKGGYKVYYRFCNTPPKLYGGRDCPGERVRKKDCTLQDCPSQKRSRDCSDRDSDCEKRKMYCHHQEYGAFTKAHCQKTCQVC
ncbi:uncharacterized protein [Clytia hemisphaerica]|uniref:ShKT domain-containing protein n=1 Tax=Clytia hemisphaerica TaxID=252671 RepID=A0A7M5UK00_9CNID